MQPKSRRDVYGTLSSLQRRYVGLTHSLFKWRLNDDEVHLAQLLSGAGYATSLVGVQHEVPGKYLAKLGYDTISPGGRAGTVGENACGQLERLSKSKAPFFISIGFVQPHRSFTMFGAEPDTSKGVYIPGYIPQETEAQKRAANKEFSEIQGAIREVDDGVGTILDKIDKLGLRDSTVVVFTADHGIAMPRAKCSLYDPGIEVPLIIQAPCWELERGKRLDGLVSNIDYFPTIAEGLGLAASDKVQGESFLSYLRGGQPYREEIFAEKTYHTHYDPIRCIRTEKHKYIINFEANSAYECPGDIMKGDIYRTAIEYYSELRAIYELYDLEKDKWELTNLSGSKEYEEIEEDLKRRLLRWMKETDDPLLKGPVGSPYYDDLMVDLREI